MPELKPVASLPMYDWPEVQWAHDALWAAMASRLGKDGIAAPGRLDRSRPLGEEWLDRGLVLSQTCGYPFATRLIGKVSLVGTPVYAVEGCEGPYYSTFIVARREERAAGLLDFSGCRFAFNSVDSLSGRIAFRIAMRAAGLDPDTEKWVETSGHRASVRAVAAGEADIASIDSVCWALAKEHERDAVSRLQVIAQTPFRPGLPFVTARRGADEIALIRAAVKHALADPASEAARLALHLAGVALVAESEYSAIAALA